MDSARLNLLEKMKTNGPPIIHITLKKYARHLISSMLDKAGPDKSSPACTSLATDLENVTACLPETTRLKGFSP